VYAEGFDRAIKRFGLLKKPIIITENGVADGKDEIVRRTFIKRYLYSLAKNVDEGQDVRGYFYWTLMDNFEW
jgi:beta-glucosidase/6-phospho-beta-glucosidase/beta-galactosidase